MPQSHSQLISANVRQVTASILKAQQARAEPGADVVLLAVSKRHPATSVAAAHAAGLQHFGENYVQEAVAKIQALAHLPLQWHFIGPLQSNKTRLVAEHFHWVHTIDKLKTAQRLSSQRAEFALGPLNLCIQVNVDADPHKAGVAPADAAHLLDQMQQLPCITVRGLMTILAADTPPRQGYDALAELFHRLRGATDGAWDTLSMGMSGDYLDAIAAGATHVRIGTAIFGERR